MVRGFLQLAEIVMWKNATKTMLRKALQHLLHIPIVGCSVEEIKYIFILHHKYADEIVFSTNHTILCSGDMLLASILDNSCPAMLWWPPEIILLFPGSLWDDLNNLWGGKEGLGSPELTLQPDATWCLHLPGAWPAGTGKFVGSSAYPRPA